MFNQPFYFKGKKNTKDIGLLLKSCEKLTDINDLLNNSIGDNTKEVISSLLNSISKTTASLEAVSSPKPLEVGQKFSFSKCDDNCVTFIGK